MTRLPRRPSRTRGLGHVAGRYGPFAAIAAAFALVIAIAPTTTPTPTNAFAGYQPPGPGPAATGGPPSSSAPSTPSGAATTGSGCEREAFLGPDVGCKPSWSGRSNGGSTYKGVSAHQVNLVYYDTSLGSQIASIAASAGASTSDATIDHAVSVYVRFFNRYYQTYGRSVHVSFFHGQGQLGDAAAARADAVAVDQQLHAFVTFGSIDSNFLDEVARRGISDIVAYQLTQAFLASHAPFLYGILPTTDTTNATLAEYVAKRLGRRSRTTFGGQQSSPPVNGRPRRYGIVYPTTNSDGSPSLYAGVADDLQRRLARYGIPVATKVGYSLDINTAQTQATNTTTQLRSAGVTTVICLCDPLSELFGTRAATAQGWYPEYLMSGYQFQDADQLARLYDPAQWRHAFGPSSLPLAAGLQQSTAWKAYKSIDPSTSPTVDDELIFGSLELLYAGLEGAGPDLNPRTFADTMFRIRLRSASPADPTFYYSRSDYGGIKDSQEVWWDPDAVGPDGVKGHYRSADGGYRWQLGSWPTTPTQVFEPQCLPARSCGAPWYSGS